MTPIRLTPPLQGLSFVRPLAAVAVLVLDLSKGVRPMFLRPLAAAAFLLVALPSHAGLVIDPAPVPVKPVSAQTSPSQAPPRANYTFGGRSDPATRLPASAVSYAQVDRVIETGGPRPEGANTPVQGWADNLPLDLALTQIVPSGWSIYADGVDGAKMVSWSGGRPWTQLLGDLAYRGGFAANVQWDTRRVVLYRAGQPAPAASALIAARVVRGQALNASDVAVDAPAQPLRIATGVATGVPCCGATPIHSAGNLASGQPAVVIAPVRAPIQAAPAAKWLIDPRLSLKQNVEAWAKQAGWSAVVWEAADYQMVAPAVFEGDFTASDGPLAKLISAYSKSDQPLQVKLSTQDRVVHVTNKNYQPAVVAPMTPSQVAPSSFDVK